MALPQNLVSALAQAIAQSSRNGYQPHEGEKDEEYVARVLPALSGELRSSRRLSPLQVALYELPKNALLQTAVDLGYEKDELKKFKQLDKSELAEQLHRLYGGKDKEALGVFVNRIFASGASVTICKMAKIPTAGEVKHYLKLVLHRDVFEDHAPKAVGSDYEVICGTIITGKIFSVTLARAIEAREAIGNDFRITTLTALQNVHLVIDPDLHMVEFRGPHVEAERALKAFTDTMKKGGHICTYQRMEFTEIHAGKLATELKADLKRIRHVDESSAHNGLRYVHATVDPMFTDEHGRNNLATSPAYLKLKESFGQDVCQYDLDLRFIHGGEPYAVAIHLASATLRFPEGVVTDEVIRFVTSKMCRILKITK